MPDYDAGTARGHIRIDGDSSGADKATRSVEGFQRALEFIASHLGGFVAAMDKIEGELNNVQGDFKDAADAADKYDRAINDVTLAHIKASKSTNDLTRNLQDLHGRLKFAHDAWADYGIPVLQATRAMNEFSKTRGGIIGVFQAVGRAGIAGAAMQALKSHFIGMGIALRQAPAWQQNLARVAQNIGLVTLAGARLGGVIPRLERGFARLVDGAEGADFAIAGFGRTLDRSIGSAARFFQALDRVPTGMFQMAGGLAVASSGLRSLATRWSALATVFGQGGGRIGQALRFILLPGVILSSAAIQGLDVLLRGFSNTVAGVWSAVKQLAGGFVAIPGAIAMIGAAVLPMVAIVKTLTSNFKDMIKAVSDNDVEKFAQAMQKIPPYLRPLAQAVANAIQPLKSLGDVLTATFVSNGLDQQFTQLVNTWLPAISMGADTVANSWKILTNYLMQFLGEAKTISGVNEIFMHTSQTMNAIGSSIQPILDGFRDLAVVGSTFWRNLAEDYLPGIADKFNAWATNAASTGRAMQWMENSVHAVKDLWDGTEQLVKALYTLLTLFQTRSGDTFLDRYANGMKKFNDEVNRSAAGGELGKIAAAVKGMGTDKLHELWQMLKDLMPAIRAIISAFGDMSQAFSSVMLPTIKAVATVVGELAKVFNDLGIASLIGYIFGASKAFGILRTAIGTAWDITKVFLGAKYVFQGIENVVMGAATTLERFGGVGQKAADMLVGGYSRVQGAINVAVGGIMAAVAAWTIYEAGVAQVNAANQAFVDSLTHVAQYTANIRQAFMDDQGIKGHNVFDTMKSSMDTFMGDLANRAQKAPGMMATISDFLQGGNQSSIADQQGQPGWMKWITQAIPLIGSYINMPTGSSDHLKQLEAESQEAQKAQKAFSDLGITAQDLAQAVSGSGPEFDALTQRLRASGDNGVAAANQLQKYRDVFNSTQADMQRAGQGAVQVADGIAKIGAAGNDSAQKLDGLKMALQGLGLLKEDAYEAAFNYAQAVQGLGDAAAKAVDPSQSLTDVIDTQSGLFNTNSVNARNLYNVLQPMAEKFLAAANAGKNINQLWSDLAPQLQTVADAFHLTQDQVIKLVQSLGVVPDTVNILVQLQGKDKMAQELGQIVVEAQTHLNNTAPLEIPIGVDAKKVSDQLNQVLNNPAATSVSGGNVVLGTGIDQRAVQTVLNALSQQYHLNVAPTGAPPVNAALPGQNIPQPAAPAPPPAVPAPGTPVPKDQKPPAPPPGPKPADLPPGLAALYPGLTAQDKPKASDKQPTALPPGVTLPPGMTGPPPAVPPAVPPPVAPPPPPPVGQPVPPAPVAPPPALAPAAPVQIPVQAPDLSGFEKIQGAFKALADTLAKNIGEWMAWSAGVGGALSQALDDVQRVFQDIDQKASEAGKKFSADFAAGITDPAALQKINDAAIAAMQQAANKLPHSPAKEGPLSGSGWSGHAGGALAGDFAQGILGGQAAVGDAANKLAGKVAGALKPKTPYGLFGFKEETEPFKDLKDILKLASDGVNMFKSVSDQIFKVIDFANDPFGTKKKAQDAAGSGGIDGLTKSQTTVGNVLNQGIAGLTGIANPSKQDIASAIAGEAQKRGYDRNTAIGIISAIMHEDPSFNPNQQELGGSDHWGLFQEQGNYAGAHGGAAGQLQWMFDQLSSLGGPAAAAKDPLGLIANQIEKGGYGAGALAQHAEAASKLYDSVLQTGALSGQGAYSLPGIGAVSANPASAASRIPIAPNVESGIQQTGVKPLYQPGSTNLPPWMNQLAQAFGLTASTYPSGGSLHQMGFAADIGGPGSDPAKLEKFAQFVQSNLAGQTLQLIFQGPSGAKYGIAGGKQVGPGTSMPGYYAGDFGQHTDHVHWATDVAPILAGANANAMPWAAGTSPQQQQTYGSQNPIQAPNVGQDRAPGPNAADAALAARLDPNNKAAADLGQVGENADQLGGQTQQVQNQTQQIQQGMSGVGNIASSVMQTMQAGLDAWGATKYIMDQMVRGISSTEDIYNLVDQFQKYITFAADVANTAGQILSTAGSMAGGADMGGAGAAGGAMQMISALLTTINNAIDMAQEAYRIWGSYFGQFLGFLAGGPGGLMGDVHFLLDQNTGQLLAYSSDNPLKKTAHGLPFQAQNPNANNQLIGQLNYYAGPGEDPRQGTRNMMYQVRASTMSTVTAQ